MNYPGVVSKSVLVTGCSSGIGLSTARLLRDGGWAVLPTARKPEDIERLCAEGYGRIVNVSSVLGRLSIPFMGIYSASKMPWKRCPTRCALNCGIRESPFRSGRIDRLDYIPAFGVSRSRVFVDGGFASTCSRADSRICFKEGRFSPGSTMIF